MTPLKIIFAGAGEFGLPALEALIGGGHEIVQVFTQPDRPAGRGKKLSPTPIGELALSRNLPLTRTANINTEQLPPADLLVVIAFGQKIADSVIHHARLKAINLHASILPKYRGAAPINAAILAGEKVAGNSIIRLAQKMDAGAVLGQSQLQIGELETAGELHDRLSLDGATLVPRIVEELANGTVKEVEQDHSRATLAPKLSRESTRLDFTRSAEQLALRIRAMHPWPACRVRLMRGEDEVGRMSLIRARATTPPPGTPARGELVESRGGQGGGHTADAGTIDADGQIITGNGRLEIVELQPESKRPMLLAEFRCGNVWDAGMRVESI